MSYKVIQDLLDGTLAGLGITQTILRENENHSGCDGYYMRTTLLPSRTETASIGETGFDRFFGLYQVDLFYPIDESPDAANTMVDKIIAGFPKKTILTSGGVNVRIVNYWRGPQQESDQKYQVPAIIQWEMYTLRQ